MLNEYLKQCQRFIRDGRQTMISPADLTSYVNRARREVAIRTQSIRKLPPISGAIISADVPMGGSGYTNPTVVITAPDFPSGTLPYPGGAQATGVATMDNGAINGVQITFGGAGYFQPQITITDPTGSGAVATPNLSFINQLNQAQEEYPFSAVDLSMFPGVGSIYMIKSVSLIYSNYRYSLPCYSFSTYQAHIRQYPHQYQWVPTICAQRGQGTDGSFMMYPIPSQPYQLEFDAFCLPLDLKSDLDTEALPGPWTDAVPFYAAHLAYLELQNFNAARGYLDLFDRQLNRYSVAARPGRATNPYGRFHWLLTAGLSSLLLGTGIC